MSVECSKSALLFTMGRISLHLEEVDLELRNKCYDSRRKRPIESELSYYLQCFRAARSRFNSNIHILAKKSESELPSKNEGVIEFAPQPRSGGLDVV